MGQNLRGLNASERFATDWVCSTASNSLVLNPCLLYGITVSKLVDGTATGAAVIADSTASGDVDKETAKMEFYLGGGGASAYTMAENREFIRPVYIQNTLVCSITGVSINVRYKNL